VLVSKFKYWFPLSLADFTEHPPPLPTLHVHALKNSYIKRPFLKL